MPIFFKPLVYNSLHNMYGLTPKTNRSGSAIVIEFFVRERQVPKGQEFPSFLAVAVGALAQLF